MKRTICFLLVILMIFSICACSDGKNSSAEEIEIDGKSVSFDYAIKINSKYSVSLAEYRYYYLTERDKIKKDYPNTQLDWTDKNLLSYLKERTLSDIYNDYAIYIIADKYKFGKNDDIDSKIDQKIIKAKQSAGSANEYQKRLTDAYMTEDIYKGVLERAYIWNLINTGLFADDAKYYDISQASVKRKYLSDYFRATYVYLPLDNDNTTTNKDLAQSILDQTKSGTRFETLVAMYNQDDSLEDPEFGYCFLEGSIDIKGFDDTVLALEDGQMSDVLTTDSGYYILKRLPLDEAFVDSNMDKLMDEYKNDITNVELAQSKKSMEIKFHPSFDKITPACFEDDSTASASSQS